MSRKPINSSMIFKTRDKQLENQVANYRRQQQHNINKYQNNLQIKKSINPNDYFRQKNKEYERITNAQLNRNRSELQNNNMVMRSGSLPINTSKEAAKQQLQQFINLKKKEEDKYSQLKVQAKNYSKDDIKIDELILFYSPKCVYSNKFIEILDNAELRSRFTLVNIHNIPRNKFPKWLTVVPTLHNKTDDTMFKGAVIFKWLSKYIKESFTFDSLQISDNEVLGYFGSELGSSGCGAYYSFIDDVLDEKKTTTNNSMPSNFEFLKEGMDAETFIRRDDYSEERLKDILNKSSGNIKNTKIKSALSSAFNDKYMYSPNVSGVNNQRQQRQQFMPQNSLLQSQKIYKPKEHIGNILNQKMQQMQQQYKQDDKAMQKMFNRQFNRANGY